MRLFIKAPRVNDLTEYRRFPVVRNEPPIREKLPTQDERDSIARIACEEWGRTPQIFKLDNTQKGAKIAS